MHFHCSTITPNFEVDLQTLHAPMHSSARGLLHFCSCGLQQQLITALRSSADTDFADLVSVDSSSDVMWDIPLLLCCPSGWRQSPVQCEQWELYA